MLSAQEDERFSTVDLADVDLWTGNVYSEKLGACASWVVRGSHMKKVEGASLPLGILEEAAATSTQYRLHSGDILVMVSDGVADAFETDEQFTQALTESLYIQPQRMADALLRNALLAGGRRAQGRHERDGAAASGPSAGQGMRRSPCIAPFRLQTKKRGGG